MHQSHRITKKRALIAINLAVLIVLAGGTVAYGALSKTVTVAIDGKTDTIRTFSSSVGDVLADKKVSLRPGDEVNRPSSAPISDGDKIAVDYAKPVTVAVDGTVRRATVHDNTVGQVLDRMKVSPGDDAKLSAKRSARVPRDGMEIVVSHPKKLTVKDNGTTKKVETAAPRVADVLKAGHVQFDSDDVVSPARDTFVKPGQTIKVIRAKAVDTTEIVDLAPPVEYRDDDSMSKGSTKVLEPGKAGKAREHVVLSVAKGKVKDRQVLTSQTITKPKVRVVARGTQEAPAVAGNSVWDKIAQCESGGNWSINTGNGYYGGLQFTLATWQSVGGTGLPSDASREEQIKRAKILQARSGWGQWGCAGARHN
ncbi:transglycosylase family protein [Aeromicrobium terrae]|uniref:transglycosylase family protein n=1 Tax=Aeromicrobium terrae TaxID=2498846 RepID=UPI00165079EF